MKRMGVGQLVLLAVLVFICIAAIVWAVSVWNVTSNIEMSIHGWIALGLGTFFSLLIGCGLMALMFYSSRSGYDERADFLGNENHPRSKERCSLKIKFDASVIPNSCCIFRAARRAGNRARFAPLERGLVC